MYIVSYRCTAGHYHEVESGLTRNEAIVLAAEGRRNGDTMRVDRQCDGHPAGPYDPLGQTVYCDGTCLPAIAD